MFFQLPSESANEKFVDLSSAFKPPCKIWVKWESSPILGVQIKKMKPPSSGHVEGWPSLATDSFFTFVCQTLSELLVMRLHVFRGNATSFEMIFTSKCFHSNGFSKEYVYIQNINFVIFWGVNFCLIPKSFYWVMVINGSDWISTFSALQVLSSAK